MSPEPSISTKQQNDKQSISNNQIEICIQHNRRDLKLRQQRSDVGTMFLNDAKHEIMICLSIHKEHSLEFSINNYSIESESVHIRSDETQSSSESSNNEKIIKREKKYNTTR